MIKFKKKMKYLKGFILYALLCIFAFLPFMSFNTYAWSVDSNGNLVSDNILKIEDQTNTSLGVSFVCSNNQITLNGTATTTGPVWFNINIPSGTYTLQDYNNFTYNDGFRISLRTGYGSLRGSLFYNTINDTTTFTSATDMNILAVSVVQGVTYNNVVLKPTLVVGTTPLTSYEPYGFTYYSDSTMEKMVQSSFGAFAYASEIRIYYNNGTVQYLYKTYSNCYDLALENWCRFINGSLRIDDYGFIFRTLGGNSSWYYYVMVDFPSSAIKVSNFKDWAFYGYSMFRFTSASNTYLLSGDYQVMNPYELDLTDNSINNYSVNDYIKSISFYRKNPNIGIPYGQFGTPNNSYYYNNGYNDGYEDGKDDGFNSGFDDGKKEGIDIGYWDGFRDGENSNFTTNGFKTLIGSIFNYPINFIRNVFNFEFMGINISSLIFFILSIGIVIFVINRFKK